MTTRVPPDLTCGCGWHVVWFGFARDGALGSCYDCGRIVEYRYETGEPAWRL